MTKEDKEKARKPKRDFFVDNENGILYIDCEALENDTLTKAAQINYDRFTDYMILDMADCPRNLLIDAGIIKGPKSKMTISKTRKAWMDKLDLDAETQKEALEVLSKDKQGAFTSFCLDACLLSQLPEAKRNEYIELIDGVELVEDAKDRALKHKELRNQMLELLSMSKKDFVYPISYSAFSAQHNKEA